MKRLARSTTASFALLALSLAACARSAESAGAPAMASAEMTAAATAPAPAMPPMAAAAADSVKLPASNGGDGSRAVDGRKIIRTGELHVRVDDYEPARQKIEALLKSSGGFIANAQVSHVDGRVLDANLTLRVPTAGYESLVAQLSTLGTVIAESTHADDVTDQWVDVSARLGNAKKLEGRLIEMVATKTGNVAELLEVERELARVREQIELFEGRLRVLDDQVSLSTLTLRVETKTTYVAAAPPTFGSDAGQTLASSWAGLVGMARGLALGGIGLLPWLPLLAAAFFALRAAWKRAKKRYLVPNKRSPASPSPGTM
jgi:hypothetical protein